MADLKELYQSVILHHNRSPRNFREISDTPHHAEGHNPLCGDNITVWVELDGDIISDASFLGNGCAISKASASLMTQAVKGKRVSEAKELFRSFQKLVTGRASPQESKDVLGKLILFAGVSEFPVRVKCASLSWHTLNAAFEDAPEAVTTE
ncbi:MAG: SUF system NifU family Fe-S cluster assembly protein [Gemmatimonadales bacterium]